MKASDLYNWLFAEGEHTYDCEIIVNDKYVKECWLHVKTGETSIEWSDKPTHHFNNEDVPCFFRFISSLDKDSIIKVECNPLPIRFDLKYLEEPREGEPTRVEITPIYSLKYKEIKFKVLEWTDDIAVCFFNSKEITTLK